MKIGDKVKCVAYHDLENITHYMLYSMGMEFPQKDGIYTIRGFHNDGVYLEEIVNPLLASNRTVEVSFHTDYFEVISEKEFIKSKITLKYNQSL